MDRNEIVTFFNKFISPIFPGAKIEPDDHFRILDRVLVGQPTRNVGDVRTNPGPVYLVLQKEPKSSIPNRVLLFRSQKAKGDGS